MKRFESDPIPRLSLEKASERRVNLKEADEDFVSGLVITYITHLWSIDSDDGETVGAIARMNFEFPETSILNQLL